MDKFIAYFRMSKDEVDQDCTEMEGTRLQKAVEEAEKTMKLTPIIKEELRLSILNRRCKENKGDIVIEEKKPLIKTVSSEGFFFTHFFETLKSV